MNKSTFFVALLAAGMHASAQSPISLSSSNMPVSGDTLRYTNVQISSLGNYQQTGTSMTWDFSNVTSTSEGVRSFKASLQTPYGFFFLSSGEYGEKIADTLVGGTSSITITNFYSFYKKQHSPSAFIADGVGLTLSSIPVPCYYTDKDELYYFPLTYPKYDSSTFKFTTPSTTLIPFTYSKAGYRVTKVDGWGTVKTPYGTDNCIRLVTTQYSMDTTKISISPLPAIKLGFPNYQRSYQWLTTTSKIPFFEVSGSVIGGNFTPTQARYRGFDPKRNATSVPEAADLSAMQMYPNPVHEKLWIAGSENITARIDILDMDGKLVCTVNPEIMGHAASVNTASLAPGLYVLRLQSGNQPAYMKFIKE
mgnify:FL=1